MNLPVERRKGGTGGFRGGIRGAAHSWVGWQTCRFPISAIAAHLHRDNVNFRVSQKCPPFPKRSKMFAVFTLQGKIPEATTGRHAGGLSAETLRPPFRQPRGPFLDRPDPGLAGRFSELAFSRARTGSSSSLRARGETIFARSSSSASGATPRTCFSFAYFGFAGRLLVWPCQELKPRRRVLWEREEKQAYRGVFRQLTARPFRLS